MRLRLSAIFFMLITASLLQAQQPSMDASVDKKEIYLGESLELEILVNNAEREVQPNLSGITNCTVKPAYSDEKILRILRDYMPNA